jgi:hypothetical protein
VTASAAAASIHAPPQPGTRRAVPVTFGAILATVGSLAAIAGAGVLVVAGADGTLSSGAHRLATPTSALVSEAATIDNTRDVTHALGTTRARVHATAAAGGPAVFVGVGPAAAVDRYLANSPRDTITDLEVDPWSLETARQPGTARPQPPARQTFWVAQSSGRAPSVDWKISDGSYRLVVMNADGSPRVATDASFELKVPHLSAIAIVALIAGLAMIAGGVALIVPSVRGPRPGAEA